MVVAQHLQHGYRVEAARTFPAGSPKLPQPRDLRVLSSPREALRLVRRQVRDNKLFALNERELDRAHRVLRRGGTVPALAALHRGESCGFSVRLDDGTRAEWRVRPVQVLVLGCPCAPGPGPGGP